MKSKTSVTISDEVLRELDQRVGSGKSRSAFVELAVRALLEQMSLQEQDARDLEIMNRNAGRLNREAMDVLRYQLAL